MTHTTHGWRHVLESVKIPVVLNWKVHDQKVAEWVNVRIEKYQTQKVPEMESVKESEIL